MEKAMAPHSSTLAWKLLWMEEPGRLRSMGSRRVRHNWATSLSLSRVGEGNGNPLQCCCLENPRNGGAWWAAIYGITQSRTRLKWLSSSSTHDLFLMCESTETTNKNLESYQCDLHLVSYLVKHFFNVQNWSSAFWEIKNAWLRHSPEFKRCLSIMSSYAFGWINPIPWNLINLGWSINNEFLILSGT